MADVAEMIYNYNPTRYYLGNRALELQTDAMNLENQRKEKIMSIEDQIANGDMSGWSRMQAYEPERVAKKYLSDEEQLKLGSKWAGAFKNIAPENRGKAYNQFIKAAPGMGIDVSDLPQYYDPATVDPFIEQLAQAGISESERFNAEEAERRQREIFAQQEKMARLNNSLAMQRANANGGDSFNNTDAGMALRILQNPDRYTPEAQAWAKLQSQKLSPEFTYDTYYNQAMGKGAGERASNWAGKEELGYYKENGKTFIIPDSDAEMQYLGENRKVLTNNEVSARAAQTVLDDIAAMKRIAKEHPNMVAGWSSLISYIPGTPMHNFAARIDSIRGNAAIDQLLNIKQSGAGLGQVPQQQLNMLADMTGNLDRAQSFDELMDVINRFERIYTNVRDGANAENNRIMSRIKNPNEEIPNSNYRSTQGLAVGTVEDGYRFNGGNPADKNNWEKIE